MSRKYRLLLQMLVILAGSSLALATIRQARNASAESTDGTNLAGGSSERENKAPKHTKERARQVVGTDKQHLTISPDQKYAVYHLPFDPYGRSTEPLIFVATDNRTGETLRKIPIEWRARTVSAVDWINDHQISVLGEAGYLAILDIEAGEQTHNLRGRDFAISPDGGRVIYSHDFNPKYGYIPPEFESDYVLLSFIMQPSSEPIGERKDRSEFHVIYPGVSAVNGFERKAYENLDERHRIKSNFAWSADSRSVAFVEVHQQKPWLIVLQPAISGESISSDFQKIALKVPTDAVAATVTWSPDGSAVQVSAGETTLSVNLKAGVVQPPPVR